MVLPAGIELATSALPKQCSTTELGQPGAQSYGSLDQNASRHRERHRK